MKKLRSFIMLSALVSAMFSCQKDPNSTSEQTSFSILTVTIPRNIETRSAADYGQGKQINRCILEIYREGKLYGERQVQEVSGNQVTFTDLVLVPNQTYDFVLWADCGDGTADKYYNTTNLSAITVHAANKAYTGNDDGFDAFYAKKTFTVTDVLSENITLSRPFGQLNVKTNDLQKIGNNYADLKPTQVQVSFKSVPTTFNALTGELGDEQAPITYTANIADETAGVLCIDYILANPQEANLSDFTISFLNQYGATLSINDNFKNVPIRRNYRTLVSGNLITKQGNITISVDSDFSGNLTSSTWNGTSETPDIDDATKTVNINTAEQFAGLAELVNAGNTFEDYTITLHTDLDFDHREWTPIGQGKRSGSDASGMSFKGVFDGNGRTISNLVITATAEADAAIGMFGIVDGGTVQNIVFQNVDIDVPTSEMAAAAVGMLTGGGRVSGIEVHGRISATRGLGAVVGRVTKDGHVSDCRNYATISGTGANVGGIVGAAYYTTEGATMTIDNCTNYGTITCTAGVTGGIVGLSAAQVSNCVNEATITGNGADVAGIVAEQQNAGSVTGCINRGDIINHSTAYGTGGIIGWVRYNGATSNYPAKNVITVSGNTNYGSIQGGNDAGGIVGTVYNLGIIEQNYNYAPNLSAQTFAAGIVGNAQFTETAIGLDQEDMVYVQNNVSSTPVDHIEANCKDLFVYINNGDKVTTSGNTFSE